VKVELAASILNLDPTHEEACRYTMEARAVSGDLIGALRLYKALWELLDEEYGMEPSPETRELVARIKLGEFERPQAPKAAALPLAAPSLANDRPLPPAAGPAQSGAPRIALLLSPFEMNGVGPDKAHLVTGFRHHLAASLVRFREWSVVDNGSGTISLPADASETVQYGIDATAYQAGPIINMVLTLRDNSRGHFVWSENFELNLEGWFEAQQRIIRRLASSLSVQLSTERLMRLASEPDVSLGTYDRWLHGQALLASFHPESWNRASRLFAEATRESPDFSPIHSSMVQMANTEHFAHPGVFRDAKKARETVARAKKAVELDPVDSRAHLCLGWSYAFAFQYDAAVLHMTLAQELNANDPGTLTSTAGFWAFCGETEKAYALAHEAIAASISPAPIHWTYYAMVLFLCGKYEMALGAIERLQEPVLTLLGWRAAALFHLDRKAEAIGEGRRFLGRVRTRWFGREPPEENVIARWLLHANPIRWPHQWERLRDGISGASISTKGIKHDVW
jgi:TolB-like protein